MSPLNIACHAPLHPLDSEKQTHGCRQTSPNVCGKHSLPGVCAFVRKDNLCLSPPNSWKRQFQKLFAQQFPKQTENGENQQAAETRQSETSGPMPP
jgi:hypothetical protein